MADETATPTPVAPVAPENVFERFIDRVKAVFIHTKPIILKAEQVAQDLEPILALTPAGPEYGIAVSAVIGAQQVAEASIAAGTNLSGTQKAQIAIDSATPALNAILTSKGVTDAKELVIKNWIQNVFNILAGPVAKVVKDVTA